MNLNKIEDLSRKQSDTTLFEEINNWETETKLTATLFLVSFLSLAFSSIMPRQKQRSLAEWRHREPEVVTGHVTSSSLTDWESDTGHGREEWTQNRNNAGQNVLQIQPSRNVGGASRWHEHVPESRARKFLLPFQLRHRCCCCRHCCTCYRRLLDSILCSWLL